ncbi:MAG TPA: HAMP domain-containing sensor histidine kinase [Solirubrobacterales bacterium]|nr:HAMP domain-containing sensor histidine kinase [Solirubrobacterales bacterium]
MAPDALSKPWRRFQRLPIRWRLTAVSASLTLAILLIFGAVVGHLATQRVRDDFNRELEGAASRLVARTRIVERPFSEPVVYSPDLADVSLPTGATARVVDVGGQILDEAPERNLRLGAPTIGIASEGHLTVATEAVVGPNSRVVGYIQYARSDDHVATTITRLWILIFGGVAGGTALAILGGVALASRAMRPVATLTSAAREITATRDLSRQLPRPVAEDEVAQLTRTLQEMLTALDASQAEREAAMQKQREFVADASHELRTPLTSILANLELLEAQLAKTSQGEEREIVTSAVRSSQRMSRLVADLLVLARSDAGQHRPMTVVDLAEVSEGACREIAPNLGGRDLEIHCDSAPMHGNHDELHRAILNLLDNAIRYSPDDAHILLRTTVDEQSDAVLLEVADSGPGIPDGMRERVFERFVRGAGGSDTDPTGGTGLGLAMVQAIVASHGGTVTAGSSAKLGGACFRLSFPKGKETPADVGPARNLS